MINSIAEYLHQLRHELTGCDPATVIDALSDTEDHLNTAVAGAIAADPQLSEAEALVDVIARYGTPSEIAAAYRETETRTRPALAKPTRYVERSAASRFFGVVYDPRAWGALLYMIISMITGIVYFTWVITGLYLSIGLLILIIGVPVAYFFLLSYRGIALVEGRIIEGLLGVRMPRRPIISNPNSKWLDRAKTLFKDGRTWLTVLYMFIMLPLGVIYFSIAIVLFALSLDFIAAPIKQYVFNLPLLDMGPYSVYIGENFMPIVMFLGACLFVVMMHVARGLGSLHAKLARAMLVGK